MLTCTSVITGQRGPVSQRNTLLFLAAPLSLFPEDDHLAWGSADHGEGSQDGRGLNRGLFALVLDALPHHKKRFSLLNVRKV